MTSPPLVGTGDEGHRFRELQSRLAPLFSEQFPDRLAPRTVVVVPSLTMDEETLAKVSGVTHYEERMLCMLMLLRLPRTQVVYLTSLPVSPWIIDYYLHLLPGIPSVHARQRLTLISCHDASPRSLTAKLLERPRVLKRVQSAIGDSSRAHMSCFTVSEFERRLALRLEIPIYGCDPDLAELGSKSGSRRLFREAGLELPSGAEDLRDEGDIVETLAWLRSESPSLRKAVVKLNDGFAGAGNGIYSYAPDGDASCGTIREQVSRNTQLEDASESWEHYCEKFAAMGGVVEEFVEGDQKCSPSVQMRVDPCGQIEVISTHDQVLGGATGQEFSGCSFPADEQYRVSIQDLGLRVGTLLGEQGVRGRFGVDFISVRERDRWRHYALEINLRKGGTTHPYMMLQFLTDGRYSTETGLYHTPSGETRYYYASDNVCDPSFIGITPFDLIDIAVRDDLHFHGSTQEGVVFHLIGAVSEFGKLGMVCVGDSPERAKGLYRESFSVLRDSAV